MLITIALYFLAINVWTFGAFWHDKAQAIAGGRRISEANLLTLSLIGGSPGALAARKAFRHKTRKEPFSTALLVIVAIQVGGLIGWFLLA
ncbi:DUF1294 domain-containing protein [Croceicoccus ponticola]|uniref:DUF1294 domain-containing protein n=1 Tax=Croceicoccus ponticola TaxID=2217664 RepID=A0A437GUZ4_9SPHN|nr:DUF1294 domain-containing protein [Croceicoccus ponticola]RVQ65319.1 DUF1294 domain-containing protein [Croceicoccus ponticola]